MEPYNEMYHRLFCAMTEAINLLKKAQQDAEALYIAAEDSRLYPIYSTKEENPLE